MLLLLSADFYSVGEVNNLVFRNVITDYLAFENFDVTNPLSFTEVRLENILEELQAFMGMIMAEMNDTCRLNYGCKMLVGL